MPGTFIVRPIEANLTHNTDLLRKMSPYCVITADNNRISGQVCPKSGKHPVWNDAITIPATNQSQVLLELMDQDKITKDDNIGSVMLNLQEAQASGKVSRWYPLMYKNKAAGEILLETVFQPTGGYAGGYGGAQGQGQYYQQEQQLYSGQTGFVQSQQQHINTGVTGHSNIFTEQRQTVEPRSFMKEVEVTETRSVMQNIEVMEPVRVVKDVQYTQAVPVRTQIEVMQPQVVIKEIEVIEPRLVTKTIQVVENVPVTRQVEVIEMRSSLQQVQTMEPQTFTKQVEVTEYVPVMKQVEVSQPVTFKKNVEFVEAIITTQTITKELQQPVVINQEVTTTVGPSSLVGVSQEYSFVQQFGQLSINDRQALTTHKRWIGYERLFGGLSEEERLYEQYRLSRLSEQEWYGEQQRLGAYNDQDRLLEQRRLFGSYRGQTGANTTGYTQQSGYSSGYTQQGGYSSSSQNQYNRGSNF